MLAQDYLSLLVKAWKGDSIPLNKADVYPLAQTVKQISRGLTGSREIVGSTYLDDHRMLGAYLCYYWPISYYAGSVLLSSLRGPLTGGAALDLGAGAGPISFALLDAGVKSVVACDLSSKALLTLDRVSHSRNLPISTRVLDLENDPPLPRGPFQVITLGYCLNELWKEDARRIQHRFKLILSLLPSLTPEGRILILEPALPILSNELLKLRDLLVEVSGLFVEAPCFRQGKCPALPTGSCHTEIPWNPPSLIREIGRKARVTDRDSVKLSYLILRKPKTGEGAESPIQTNLHGEGLPHRVVSDPLLAKSGRVRILLCGYRGRFPLSAPKQPSPRDPLRTFFSLKRGDVVEFYNVEARETGYGVGPDSVIRVLLREGVQRQTR